MGWNDASAPSRYTARGARGHRRLATGTNDLIVDALRDIGVPAGMLSPADARLLLGRHDVAIGRFDVRASLDGVQPGLEVLTELELDALTELVNLGVSRAAANLAVMVREEVLLTVPKVALMSRSDAIRTLAERESRELVAVHQTFEGAIVGRALLIFPEENSLELVRSLVGAELSNEDIIELEQEALAALPRGAES